MIGFYYKEIQLGILSYDDKTQEFVYNSIEKNEKKAREKYHMLEYYGLANSKNKRQKEIFEDFSEFVQVLSRYDIVELTKINKDEHLYKKLEKLASLGLNDDDFHIKNC